jgi:hypothetical protein
MKAKRKNLRSKGHIFVPNVIEFAGAEQLKITINGPAC